MLAEIFFSKIKKEAFRLELLSYYNVEGERDSFKRFEEGIQVSPDKELLQFCKIISNFIKQGKRVVRVHVIPKKLTNYLKFEIKTGYLPQLKAGAEIYLIYFDKYLDVLESDFNPNDFWAFDNNTVVKLMYDKQGRFLNEKLVENRDLLEKYIKLKNTLIKNAIPLNKWLKLNKKTLAV